MQRKSLHPLLAMLLLLGIALPAGAQPPDAASSPASAASQPAPRKLDRSGKVRVGKASFYAPKFAGRPMADGTPMDPHDDNAASKTLPLGTRARVTNLETGRSAVVTIQDRGPYVPGRILDVSPSTARELGITHEDGVAKVEVAPIVVPQADGSLKPGAALADPQAR
jgi:rare lipoprotein A